MKKTILTTSLLMLLPTLASASEHKQEHKQQTEQLSCFCKHSKDSETKDSETKDSETKDSETKDSETKDSETKDSETKDSGRYGVCVCPDGSYGYYTNATNANKGNFVSGFREIRGE